MLSEKQNSSGIKSWTAFLVILVFFCLIYKKILDHPNQFLVAGGDGMKNYYTFMYHIAHDSTWLGFEGMNYPFGENIVFTDNQPLLANAVKCLSHVFPSLICYLPAIHNLSLLAGLIIGAFGLFLCFRARQVAPGFALIATLGLMLMHPQADRIHGHFAMFYPVLPWLFLLWLRSVEHGPDWRRDTLTGGIILLSGLLHMYYFITGGILSVLSILVLLADRRQTGLSWFSAGRSFLLQVCIPFILLYAVSSVYMAASDRPSSPWGFFEFHSYWEGLFFSYRLPLYHLIHSYLMPVRDFDVEGKYYIGIIAVLFFLWAAISGLRQVIGYVRDRWVGRTAVAILLPGGTERWLWGLFILSALISFGYPFTISGLEGLLDYTGPFKQFRSIGRVAWVSFYALNLLAVPAVYHWWHRHAEDPRKQILYYVLPGIALVEGAMFYFTKPIQQTELPAYYCTDAFGTLPIRSEEYQGLLPDPYFSVGSEGFAWWEQGQNVNQAFALSYRLGLPTLGTHLSRTSHAQAMLLNALVCQPYEVPEIIRILQQKDNRPLLVVESRLEIREHRCRITHWTDGAPVVFENDEFRLRRLELSSFEEKVRVFTDSIQSLPTPVATPLTFTKVKGVKGWGYESYLAADSTMRGQKTIGYWITASDAPTVHSITEVWQYDANHNQLDYIGEANRFNYKKVTGNRLWIETPVFIKDQTTKIVVRVSKDRMKEKDTLTLSEAQLRLR